MQHFCIFAPNMGKGVAIKEKPIFPGWALGTFLGVAGSITK